MHFLQAQQVKNSSAMQETQEMQLRSLDQEDPLKKEWQPTPVFLLGKPHGLGSLAGYNPMGRKVGHDWPTKHSTSNMQKVNKILFSHWCYLKFTLGDDTCPITHVCQAILERESLSQEGEGKPGSSDPALKEFILPRMWQKLKGTTTEAEEKRQDQTLVEERHFHHAFVSTRESHFLANW